MKRTRAIRQPNSGAILKWARMDGDDDVCVAWAAGEKGVAYALLNMVTAHRAELEAAGLDITTIRITANSTNGHKA